MAGFVFPVDRTAILTFASALGETNRAYYDEKYAKEVGLGGVIAPPTFLTASSHWNPNYGLKGVRRIPERPKEEAPSASRGGETGGRRGGGGNLARVLHGEQHYEYHKPLHPSMELTVSTRPGKTWEKEGKRGGKLRFSESVTEYRDGRGDLVATATSVGIVTEKAVE